MKKTCVKRFYILQSEDSMTDIETELKRLKELILRHDTTFCEVEYRDEIALHAVQVVPKLISLVEKYRVVLDSYSKGWTKIDMAYEPLFSKKQFY